METEGWARESAVPTIHGLEYDDPVLRDMLPIFYTEPFSLRSPWPPLWSMIAEFLSQVLHKLGPVILSVYVLQGTRVAVLTIS